MAVNLTATVNPGQSRSRKPLTKIEIFEDLVSKSCKIIWKTTSTSIETSGCFIQRYQRDVEVFTCFHEASWKLAKITILYQSHSWKASLAKDVNSDLAAYYDLAILSLEGEVFSLPFFPLQGFTEFPVLGEDIFFSGCPLGENLPLTHMGYVSGVEEDSGNFKIDGTILRGHSGGPVVRTNAKGLEIIGVISSQLVDLTQTFLKISQQTPAPFRAYNDPAPSYAGGFSTVSAIKHLTQAFLSNVSTGIGNIRFASLHIITTSSVPLTQKDIDLSSPVLEDEYGASAVFASMQRPDPWMQRKLGITSPPSLTAEESKVAELPAMRGEHLPAGARKKSPEWQWAHQIKTNNRSLFNDITGRENNKGKERSRGKDNITDPEYALLVEYFYLKQGIQNRDVQEEDIVNSSQRPAAEKRLLQELVEKPLKPVEPSSFEKIQKAVKKFENSLNDTRPKSRKWGRDEIETKKNELIIEILTLPEGENREALIQEVKDL